MRIDQLPISRQGLTEFTYARYLVPYLCKFKGEALFLDADMLCLDDIYKLKRSIREYIKSSKDHFPPPLYVVQDGVEQFEWPSLMYFHNTRCEGLTPEFIDDRSTSPQKWVFSNSGYLPKDWNHIVPYSGVNPDAKIVHYTQGIPIWEETKGCEYSDEWWEEYKSMCSSCAFEDLMGNSVHKQRMMR